MHHATPSTGPRTAAALAAVLVLLAVALWPSRAHADAAQVSIVSPGGAEQTLALEALAGSEDVVDRTYTLRGESGETTETLTGFSLAQLIDVAGADPYSFSYLELQRPSGGAVLLSRYQALDQGAFAEGTPVVYAAAGGTGFLRPSSGGDDANANDSFQAPQGISVVLRKGAPLRVEATASAVKIRPGKPVKFSAVVQQAGAGEQLSFSWNFDDGGAATGEEATHKFAKRGSYDVVLGVTSPGNEAGTSAVVTIQVGEPLGGPDRKGGGSNKAAGAPDHGSSDGPSTGAEGSSGTNPSADSSTPSANPSPAAKAPAACRPEGDKCRPERQEEPDGEEISGELLSSSTTPVAKPDQAQAAARTGNLDGDGEDGLGLSTTAAGVLGTIGLLGLGGLLEARGLGGLLPGRRGGLA